MAGIGGLSGATRRALMGTALTGTLLLAACGSSGSKAAATQPSTAATSTGSGVASSAPSSAPSSAAAKAVSGDSGSTFCQKARDETAAEAKNTAALTSNDPTALKKLEENAIKQLPEFVALAPSAIKSAVNVLAQADQTVFNALEKTNFDFTKLPTSVTTAFSDPKFEQAATTVANYEEKVCGIKIDTGIPSSAG